MAQLELNIGAPRETNRTSNILAASPASRFRERCHWSAMHVLFIYLFIYLYLFINKSGLLFGEHFEGELLGSVTKDHAVIILSLDPPRPDTFSRAQADGFRRGDIAQHDNGF